MAKTEITHSCGHIATIDIVGPSKDRPRLEAYHASRVCKECYRAAQATEAAKATSELPALTGSAAQEQWATSIRADVVAEIDKALARMANETEANKAIVRQVMIAEVAKITDSKVWIEALRGANFGQLVQYAFGTQEAFTAAITAAGVKRGS